MLRQMRFSLRRHLFADNMDRIFLAFSFSSSFTMSRPGRLLIFSAIDFSTKMQPSNSSAKTSFNSRRLMDGHVLRQKNLKLVTVYSNPSLEQKSSGRRIVSWIPSFPYLASGWLHFMTGCCGSPLACSGQRCT